MFDKDKIFEEALRPFFNSDKERIKVCSISKEVTLNMANILMQEMRKDNIKNNVKLGEYMAQTELHETIKVLAHANCIFLDSLVDMIVKNHPEHKGLDITFVAHEFITMYLRANIDLNLRRHVRDSIIDEFKQMQEDMK